MNSVSLEKLKTLIEINSEISSTYSDMHALLIHILKSAMRLVKCESSSFLLVNNVDSTLKFAVALGPKGEEAKDISVGMNSIAGWVVANHQHVIINNVNDDSRYSMLVQNKTGYVTYTLMAVPIDIGGRCIGVLELINKAEGQKFTEDDLKILELLTVPAGIAYESAEKILAQQEQISVLKRDLSIKNSVPSACHEFIVRSPAISDLMVVLKKVAATNSSVLITGESGSGKELFAEQIYLNSSRAARPFVRVNCAALSETLMESELFGHVRGAFTSADAARKGRFETADGGTIFLDEVGEIPLALQPKLLRVIQDKQFERVGSSETISVDVRIIAATNRNLEEMVREGKFREDLYFRLNVMPIRVPPLRERPEDIYALADFFLKKYERDVNKIFSGFSDSALRAMRDYRWPGNVRELENSIARACIVGIPPLIQSGDLHLAAGGEKNGSVLNPDELADEYVSETEGDRTLKTAVNKFKRAYVIKILEQCSWNQTKAGKILGIQRTYVSRLLNELHIRDAE